MILASLRNSKEVSMNGAQELSKDQRKAGADLTGLKSNEQSLNLGGYQRLNLGS